MFIHKHISDEVWTFIINLHTIFSLAFNRNNTINFIYKKSQIGGFDMLILWIITLIFFIIALVLLSGKGANLIAGFNSLPPEKKKKYNKKKLSRSVGLMTLLIDIGLILLSLYIQFRIIPAQSIDALSTEITIVAISFLLYVILLIIIWILMGRKNK